MNATTAAIDEYSASVHPGEQYTPGALACAGRLEHRPLEPATGPGPKSEPGAASDHARSLSDPQGTRLTQRRDLARPAAEPVIRAQRTSVVDQPRRQDRGYGPSDLNRRQAAVEVEVQYQVVQSRNPVGFVVFAERPESRTLPSPSFTYASPSGFVATEISGT